MAYDPTLPANNAPIVAAELRNQLAGLKTLIDARPTQTAVDASINANSAGNTSAVTHLSLTVSNPPTQAQVQAIANKIDQLLLYLNREF